MSYQEQVVCDVCGSVRGPSNHWWISMHEDGVFVLRPWDSYLSKQENYLHICGQQCASTLQERWMSEQSSQ